jgi:hypothetical protein
MNDGGCATATPNKQITAAANKHIEIERLAIGLPTLTLIA